MVMCKNVLNLDVRWNLYFLKVGRFLYSWLELRKMILKVVFFRIIKIFLIVLLVLLCLGMG